ncbi:unnamed protein product [Acanthoscelides obtectus]|uniref:Uncharacterized protein n=1 Tax=Acanthoscelides obtectus TaxID=200917 RepID=A0A9P0PCN3_ACAOB|nr:unnamed protein product [Acanthoscelides obtectus]CAK1655141.1 hypothetical protein AOBTE_LOCUS19045 [Acanthoscelides obtectus]
MNQEIYEELLFARTLITDTKAFLARVKLMKQNIGGGEFSQFPNLSQTSCQEDDVSTYVQHLNALYSDFESRFEDILTMDTVEHSHVNRKACVAGALLDLQGYILSGFRRTCRSYRDSW